MERFRSRLTAAQHDALSNTWAFHVRDEQRPPEGDWTTWIYLGGRGAGKTRAGAEWVRARVESGCRRIAIVGANANDARYVMVEGESGLLSVASPWLRAKFEPSKRLITWPNGAIATLYSAEDPDMLRGPQHDTAWCDELAKWTYLEAAFDNLQLGLRLGQRPQQMVTTTPRALPVLKSLMQRSDSVITRSTSYDNRDNLAPAFFAHVISRYEGTRFGRQEIDAEILDEIQGALWSRAMIDEALVARSVPVPKMVRVVVGVDPSGTRGQDGRDSVGIVVAGKAIDGRCYVMDDWTCSLSPAGWGRRVAEAVPLHKADCVVAEENFGGAMVESVLLAAQVGTRIKMVHASHGKIARAEPISALYEQRRVGHAGAFTQLEDQFCALTPDGYLGKGSPDRADAAIWALTELMLSGGEDGWLNIAAEVVAAKGGLN
jgi:phage terminase large subunit-like protein